jgi:hypothetical protein
MSIQSFDNFKINEDSKYEGHAILFTDVVGSSQKWSNDPQTMKIQLDKHFTIVNDIAKKHEGFVVKTIGDAFMIYFKRTNNTLLHAIECGIEILKSEDLPLRIGICYGDMEEKTYVLQNAKLRDFFGNTVNTASRMESKVAEAGGIAFTYSKPLSKEQSIACRKAIDKYNPRAIKFSANPNDDKELQGKRSGRLLSDLHIEKTKNISDLKGVKELTAFGLKVK